MEENFVTQEQLEALRQEVHEIRDAHLTLRGEFDLQPKHKAVGDESTKTLMAATVVELEQQLKYAEYAVSTRDAKIIELEQTVQTIKLQAIELMNQIPIQGGAEQLTPATELALEIVDEGTQETLAIENTQETLVIEDIQDKPAESSIEDTAVISEIEPLEKPTKKGRGDK